MQHTVKTQDSGSKIVRSVVPKYVYVLHPMSYIEGLCLWWSFCQHSKYVFRGGKN